MIISGKLKGKKKKEREGCREKMFEKVDYRHKKEKWKWSDKYKELHKTGVLLSAYVDMAHIEGI